MSRLTPGGASLVTIQTGLLKNRQFVCNLKTERPYFVGNYELDVVNVLQKNIRPGTVVYDVGVHRGYFSLLMATLVGDQGRVVGFEPNPSTFKEAIENVARNEDLASRIDFYEYAISNRSGEVQFVAGSAASQTAKIAKASTSASTSQSPKAIRVQSITFDDFISHGNPPPSFVKIDIEGEEEFAFEGATMMLKSHRPKMIVEIHHGRAWQAICALMPKWGYIGYSLLDQSNELVSSDLKESIFPISILLVPAEERRAAER